MGSSTSRDPGFFTRLLAASQGATVPLLDARAHAALSGGALLAGERGHKVVGPWHLLLALLALDEVEQALKQLGVLQAVKVLAFGKVEAIPRPRWRWGRTRYKDTSFISRGMMAAMSQGVKATTPLHLLAGVALDDAVRAGLSSVEVDARALALFERYGVDAPRPDATLQNQDDAVLWLHNDDLTPMAFVQAILEDVMHLPPQDAHATMQVVHTADRAPLGRMSTLEARLRGEAIMDAAWIQGYPLQCTWQRPGREDHP